MFVKDSRAVFYFSLEDKCRELDVFKFPLKDKGITLDAFNVLLKDKSKSMAYGDTLCESIAIPPEEIFGYESMGGCFFKGMHIVESYLKYKDMFKGNDETFPIPIVVNKNFKSECEVECMEVNFEWRNKSYLIVTQFFAGGVTTLSFTQDDSGTKVITEYAPD
ncbi:hypothetical protein [Xenorhabdus szentirmaii]|uniref:Uncharacterized protein n=1 Tax=Xenorhabdus szentirmaii DSM 16338 TaxID=1427518 RepID=W1J531_9GAMM|nr:hypothetical protein [Xenorhabdus szentirmaii]PHM31465.1 hypothetical protein Xsze_02160 [Xenorhabdus szentirmaii DSM 16338]CDL85173.1 hypothetical protein XSR1_640003 [Xenorhabdus szentirmaii DSM 16338]